MKRKPRWDSTVLIFLVPLFFALVSSQLTHAQAEPPVIEMFAANCEVQTVCAEIPIIEIFDTSPDAASHFLRMRMNDEPAFDCEASYCKLAMSQPTADTGAWLTVWAIDKNGEMIAERDAYFILRQVAREPAMHYFDFRPMTPLSEVPLGSEVWSVFPSPAEQSYLPGSVLDSKLSLEDLWTTYKLHGLCQELIFRGKVKPESCHGYGFVDGKTVNHCALEACRDAAIREQNRANQSIFQAARVHGIPPMILKQLILAESQFTTMPIREGEHGLGHLTHLGVDTLLRWSEPFYREACAKAYPSLPERCEEDYHQLDAAYQTLLRSVILRSVQADEGVSLTAAILSACMAQAGFLVERLSYDGIADVVPYKTLWKLSVATYHGGADCTQNALVRTVKLKYALDWENIRKNYTGKCRSAAAYVDKIFNPQYDNY